MYKYKFLASFIGAFGLAVVLLAIVVVMPGQAKSILDPGDIAIIGYNFDGTDTFAFVALVQIDAGAMITFTDNGWTAGGTFRPGEGTLVWTAASSIATGTVIQPSDMGTMSFSASGDQILAYQGSNSTPSFVYALQSNTSGWQSDAGDSNSSTLPTGLINGSTAVAIPEVDNAIYTGTTFSNLSHNAAYFLPLIGDSTNWQTSDDTSFTMPSTTFTGPNAVTVQKISAASPLFSFAATVVLAAGLVVLRKRC